MKFYLKVNTIPNDINTKVLINGISTNTSMIEANTKVNIKVELSGYEDFEKNFLMPSQDSFYNIKLKEKSKDIKNKDITITPTDEVQKLEVPFGYSGYGNITVEASSDDSKTIQAYDGIQYDIHAGDKVFVGGNLWENNNEYQINSITALIENQCSDIWSGTALEDMSLGDTGSVKIQVAKFPLVTLTVNTVPEDANVTMSYINRFIDDLNDTTYYSLGNEDHIPTYTEVTVEVSKEGYETTTEVISVEDEDITTAIELQPS